METHSHNQLHNYILSVLQEEIRRIRKLEDDGYMLDDNPYTKGVSYWFYSDIGAERITVSHTKSKPVYPEGDWLFAATTQDGHIDNDNTNAAACNVMQIRNMTL